MAGPTIDHMVSITVLVAAILLTFGLYTQIIASAHAYQRNHQVVMKAVDLMNTICLSPGKPPNWGQTNSTPLVFGLQNPGSAGYTLSPFSIMRLNSSDGTRIYYPEKGMWFSNVSMGQGGFLGVPVADCVNYTRVAELLGANGSYGFQLTIAPTVRVSVSEIVASPLTLKIEVRGSGLAISDATLNYYLSRVYKPDDSNYTSIQLIPGTNQTDSTGSAFLDFPGINGTQSAYSIIVYAHLGGLNGVGYYSHDAPSGYPQYIVPFVEDFEQGTIIVAHNWNGAPANVFYNATFFVPTENFELRSIQIANATGHLNYGEGKSYNTLQVPASEPGILFISYQSENRCGTVMMPWGISTLGVSVTFGGDPSGYSFVATELRQVIVNEMSYQVKLAVWSLEN